MRPVAKLAGTSAALCGARARGAALRACSTAPGGDDSLRATREAALKTWNAQAAAGGGSGGGKGRGMQFASGLAGAVGLSPSRRVASEVEGTTLSVADVKWDACERMDYYVQYSVPAGWRAAEVVRDNSLAVQCCPPPAAGDGRPLVHGMSLNCFAYMRRVAEPDCARLLRLFLRRFNASVGNSLEVLAESAGAGAAGGEAAAGLSAALATQLRCAVAEVTFTPGPGQPLARGLCRAFYNSNGRFHYVVLVAVPASEYAATEDLVIHCLVSVAESKVEAAAKWT